MQVKLERQLKEKILQKVTLSWKKGYRRIVISETTIATSEP